MTDLATGGIVPSGSVPFVEPDSGTECYIPLTPCEITRSAIRTAALLAATRIVNNRIDNDEE